MGFLYYKQFDYKFNIARQGKYDVFICRKNNRPPGVPCIDWNYYSRSNMAVVVNCHLPEDKVVVNAVPIKD